MEELKKQKAQFMIYTNVGSPPLVSVPSAEPQECLQFLSDKHHKLLTFKQHFKCFAVQLKIENKETYTVVVSMTSKLSESQS